MFDSRPAAGLLALAGGSEAQPDPASALAGAAHLKLVWCARIVSAVS